MTHRPHMFCAVSMPPPQNMTVGSGWLRRLAVHKRRSGCQLDQPHKLLRPVRDRPVLPPDRDARRDHAGGPGRQHSRCADLLVRRGAHSRPPWHRSIQSFRSSVLSPLETIDSSAADLLPGSGTLGPAPGTRLAVRGLGTPTRPGSLTATSRPSDTVRNCADGGLVLLPAAKPAPAVAAARAATAAAAPVAHILCHPWLTAACAATPAGGTLNMNIAPAADGLLNASVVAVMHEAGTAINDTFRLNNAGMAHSTSGACKDGVVVVEVTEQAFDYIVTMEDLTHGQRIGNCARHLPSLRRFAAAPPTFQLPKPFPPLTRGFGLRRLDRLQAQGRAGVGGPGPSRAEEHLALGARARLGPPGGRGWARAAARQKRGRRRGRIGGKATESRQQGNAEQAPASNRLRSHPGPFTESGLAPLFAGHRPAGRPRRTGSVCWPQADRPAGGGDGWPADRCCSL